VVQAQNEISALESAIKKKQGQLTNYEATKDINASDILDAYSTALANDVEVMNQRLQTLQGMASQEEKKSKELVNFELTDKIMTSRVERKQALYDAVVSRLHDLNLRSGYGSYVNALLVTPTTGGRVWPRLSICGAAGAAGGFLLGCMIAVAGYLTNGRFRTMGELRQSLSIPVLASLPRIRTAFHGYSLSPEEKAAGRANWDPHLAVQFSPRSPAANAIRGLRNSLLVARSNPSGNLLFLTSPRNGSGASTTAANLALSIAQAGRSVLLVDANSGKPRLHTMFGYQRVPGLAEVLEGTADLPDTTVALDTHLRLLTAGEPMRTPADVFQSTRFIEFCEMVRSRYEWIIFDGPPVLDSSEAQVLASIISDTLLVVRVGKDKREQVLKAGSEIVRHGGHFVGIVANAWDAQSGFFADDWIRTEEVGRQVPTYEVVHSGNGNGYARPEVNPAAKS
jgi:polysaccharide biosynthesis transport protein